MKIGIIGYGKMGRLFSDLFHKNGYEVLINDIKLKSLDLNNLVSESNYIMISVSPNKTKSIINKLLDFSDDLKGKLIFDTQTFKEDLIETYNKFPKDVLVTSIHPLFGPGMKNPRKHFIAIIPVSKENDGSRLAEEIFSRIGFNVFQIDYKTHDEIISKTIGLSYIIGISVNEMLKTYDDKEIERLSGTTFKYLRNHYLSILGDVPDFANYILSRKSVKTTIIQYKKIIEDLYKDRTRKNILESLNNKNDEKIKDAYKKLYDCIESY